MKTIQTLLIIHAVLFGGATFSRGEDGLLERMGSLVRQETVVYALKELSDYRFPGSVPEGKRLETRLAQIRKAYEEDKIGPGRGGRILPKKPDSFLPLLLNAIEEQTKKGGSFLGYRFLLLDDSNYGDIFSSPENKPECRYLGPPGEERFVLAAATPAVYGETGVYTYIVFLGGYSLRKDMGKSITHIVEAIGDRPYCDWTNWQMAETADWGELFDRLEEVKAGDEQVFNELFVAHFMFPNFLAASQQYSAIEIRKRLEKKSPPQDAPEKPRRDGGVDIEGMEAAHYLSANIWKSGKPWLTFRGYTYMVLFAEDEKKGNAVFLLVATPEKYGHSGKLTFLYDLGDEAMIMKDLGRDKTANETWGRLYDDATNEDKIPFLQEKRISVFLRNGRLTVENLVDLSKPTSAAACGFSSIP